MTDTPIFTRFAHHSAPSGLDANLTAIIDEIRSGQWAHLVTVAREAYASGGKDAAKPFKSALPCVTFSGKFANTQASGLVAHSGLICADLDALGERLPTVRASITTDPHTVASFISPSGDGLKVVLRCDPARPHLQSFHAAAAHVLSITGETIDKACKNVNRLCYVSHDPDAFLASDLSAVPLLSYPAAVSANANTVGTFEGFDDEAPPSAETLALARAHLAKLPPAISGDGGSVTTFKAALALAWGFGLGDADALPLLQEYNAKCVPPWTDDELLHKLAGARQDAEGKPPFKYLMHAEVIPGEPMEAGGHATDLDASLRFAESQSGVLRYVNGLGWLHWNGRRWAEDSEGRALELSKQSARKWHLRAVASNAEAEVRSRMIKAASALESASHIRAAVELAKSDPRMVLRSDKLDLDTYALNVANGTLDLRTGSLRAHRREDFITKLAPVKFVPGATHPALTKYLNTLDATEAGTSAFLARCFGAALTGDASPESLFLLQGEGGSGKTTLVEAMAHLLGDYAVKLPFESFVLSRHGRSPGGASPDLIKLRGSRLAYASEGDKSARLDAGVIKTLTGNEPLTARALYASPITFDQTWKLWLVSNYDPRADSEDTGIWRRMIKLRFEVIPEAERDPAVKRALFSDPDARSALLAWALAGCLDWQTRGGGRKGLALPASFQALTEAYRQKQDVLGQWWDDLLASDAKLNPTGRATATALRRHYEDWCKENGERAVASLRFAEHLRAKGMTNEKGAKGVRYWRGVEMEYDACPFTKSPPLAA